MHVSLLCVCVCTILLHDPLHCMLQANEKNSKKAIIFLLKNGGKYEIKVISSINIMHFAIYLYHTKPFPYTRTHTTHTHRI